MTEALRLLARTAAPWRPWSGWILLSIVVALVATLADVGLTAVAGWFVTAMAVAGANGVAMNYFSPAAIIRALAILRTGGRYGERVVGHEATFRLIAAMRVHLFTRLEAIAPAGLEDLRSGDAAVRLQGDVDRIDLVFLRLATPTLVALATAALVVVIVGRFDAGFAVVVLVAVGVGGLGGPLLAARFAATASARTATTAAMLRARLVDDLEGATAALVTGAARSRAAATTDLHDGLVTAEATTARAAATARAGLGLAADLGVVGLLVVGAPLVAAGRIDGADWTAVVMLGLVVLEPFAALPGGFAGLPATLASARRIFETIDRPIPVRDPAEPIEPDGLRLEIEGVGSTRPGAARPALDGIDLTIEPGERVALIGASGAGKTSLLELLVRFRDPTRGVIRLGGVALASMSLAALRARIVLVGQDPHLFSTTVAANLRLARPEASDAALWAVIAAVGLEARVSALADGLDTPVGTAGAKLSGGEARRLAVARALLSEAPILLFDEPTEGLDPETAGRVIDTILTRAADRTVVVATHLPIATSRLDRVIELDAGRTVDDRA